MSTTTRIDAPAQTLHLAAEVSLTAAAPGEKRPARVAMKVYGGGTMRVQALGMVGVELAGVKSNSAIPVLVDHKNSIDGVAGTGTVEVRGSELWVTGTLHDSPAGRQVRDLLTAGSPLQASIGLSVDKAVRVRAGEQVKLNGTVITAGDEGLLHVLAGNLREVSVVPIGADGSTTVSIAAKGNIKMATDSTITTDPTAPSPTVQDIMAERERAKAIVQAAAGYPDIAAKALDSGWTLDQTNLEVLRATRPRAPFASFGTLPTDAGTVLAAAACLNAGLGEQFLAKQFDAKTLDAASARDFRGTSLHAILRHTIRAAGGTVPDRMNDDAIRTAFNADRQLQASGFSMNSMSGILSNIAGKAMLAAFNGVATTWSLFCAEGNLNDFKQHKRYRLTGIGQFTEVGPDGQLKHIKLTESDFSIQATTKGAMLGITRVDIVNDDLGALTEAPRILGRMSSIAMEKAVYTLLLSNPSNFFHTSNGNYLSGSGSGLAIDSLSDAEQEFIDQTDANGDPILVTPRVLLVPSTLKTTAMSLVNSTEIVGASSATPSGNPHYQRFTAAATPWLNAQSLTGSSDTAWYLLASPADLAIMEVGFLNGQRQPTIETSDVDFNQLGVQMRGYYDFGVAMRDHRAGVKVAGA